MARGLDDQRGKLYEATVALFLKQSHLQYAYDVPIRDRAVCSDFIIPNATKPKIVLLVTHSMVEAGTNVKLWRNIDELFAVKSYDPNIIAVNVLFPGHYRKAHLAFYDAVCDLQISISKNCIEPILEPSVIKSISGASLKQCVDILEGALQRHRPWKIFVATERAKLKSCVSKKQLHQLWQHESIRIKSPATLSRQFHLSETRIKLGLVKRALLRDDLRKIYDSLVSSSTVASKSAEQSIAFKNYSSKAPGNNPKSGRTPWVSIRKSLKGEVLQVADKDLLFLKQELPAGLLQRLDAVMALKYNKKLAQYKEKANAVTGSSAQMIEMIESLFSAKDASKELTQKVTQHHTTHLGERNAPFEMVKAIVRSCGTNPSFAALSTEVRLPSVNGPGRHHYMDFFVRGQNKISSAHGDVTGGTVASYCTALTNRLLQQGKEVLIPAIPQMCQKELDHIVSTLNKHTQINHLEELVRIILEDHGYNVDSKRTTKPSALATWAGVPRGIGRVNFTFLAHRGKESLVCQAAAAYDATHKHREWAGKRRCWPYTWDTQNSQFLIDPAEKMRRYILVLDGLWPQLIGDNDKFKNELWGAGWTDIVDVVSLIRNPDRFLGPSSKDAKS